MDWAIKTLKESEIDKLATPWACVRKSTLLQVATTRVAAVRADVAMKPVDVMGYKEPVHLLALEVVEPFEMLVVKARTKNCFHRWVPMLFHPCNGFKRWHSSTRVDSDRCLHGPKEKKQGQYPLFYVTRQGHLSSSGRGRRLPKYRLETRYLVLV